ncbi:Homeobox protein cut-like [Trichinella spiralis]|uniref:Homeobox protein cut-like n=1 Tax=Trichinella spiralis TaxID=6334 RepID=A0ABR3KWL0_TRISP
MKYPNITSERIMTKLECMHCNIYQYTIQFARKRNKEQKYKCSIREFKKSTKQTGKTIKIEKFVILIGELKLSRYLLYVNKCKLSSV